MLTAVAYAPVLDAPLVYEDEYWATTASAAIVKPAGRAEWIPTRILSTASLGVTRTLTGNDPRWFHAGNLALHLVNGLLVYAVAVHLVSPWAAVMAAAVFLWLPLNSQAVSYVSARSDLLMSSFALIATWAALRAVWWRWLLVAVALVGAGMSKEIGLIAVPLVLLTACLLRPSRSAWIASAAVAIGGVVLLWQARAVVDGWHQAPELGWVVTLGAMHTLLWHLLSLAIWPVSLSIDHDVWSLGLGWDVFAVIGSGLALSAAVLCWRDRPLVTWGACWAALSVLPRFVFPTQEWIHEQHLYLAMVAVCLGVGALAARFVRLSPSLVVQEG